MKKPKDIQSLTDRLANAAATPAGAAAVTPPSIEALAAAPRPRARKRGSVSVFLRMQPEMFAKADAEAVSRTKETGRGVTVQQVILEKLAGVL
jgi:hypothetical protein